MGSGSDWPTMSKAAEVLEQFGVPHETRVVSAHRMPDEMFAYAESAEGRGLRAIIAGAGGAAHLPGHALGEDDRARARCSRRVAPSQRARLAAVDRADAGRRADRDVRDRRGGRHQRGAVRGGDAGGRRRRRAGRSRCARIATSGASRRPRPNCHRHDADPARRHASACSAAGSSGATR